MFNSHIDLFKNRRFLPLFITQFCGCFNDNIIKQALVILITFKAISLGPISYQALGVLAAGIFIFPFLLFAGIAGQVADKFEKSRLVQIIKATEVPIVIIAAYGFFNENIPVLLFALFATGVHSTFFGPLKYSILPEHLKKEELIEANGYFESGTFIAILIGTLLGGLYSGGFVGVIAFLMVACAIVGLVSSFYIPKCEIIAPDLKLNRNLVDEIKNILEYSYGKRNLFLCMLGISWFWFIGATFLSQIAAFAKDILGADSTVATLFLIVFSVGVAVGSGICSKILGDEITAKYIFMASIGISIFGIDLYFASLESCVDCIVADVDLINFKSFLSHLRNWRIVFDLFMIAVIGGIYIVPLYAVMQYYSTPAFRSRVIAANNVLNSLFMIASTVYVGLLIQVGISIPVIILSICVMNIGVAVYAFKLTPNAKIIPRSLLRFVFKMYFDRLYRVEVKGIENYHKAGKRAVIVANHLSFLDPALLSVYLSKDLIFAINTAVAQKWWVKPFLKLVKTYPLDPNDSFAVKSLINEVKKNNHIGIFPEGRISVTGSLMKVYEGPGMIADRADATILPVRIDGTQYTFFSKIWRLSGTKLFPKFTITILPPVKIHAPEELDNRARRKYIGIRLYDIMAEMMFESSDYNEELFLSLLDAGRNYKYSRSIVNDFSNNNATYRQIILKSFILGEVIGRSSDKGEILGLMLPNTTNTLIAFFAMQFAGRVPAMLNFSSGSANVVHACKTANIKTVYTSRQFIEKAGLEEVIEKLTSEVKIVYLEDLRSKITLGLKLKALIGSYFPYSYYQLSKEEINPQKDPAVILFTSGTLGKPKGVALSHTNIQSNRCQVSALVDFGTQDIAFNALPMFHSFGLTAATLLPVLYGIKTFLYPSPLHYRVVPELVYDIGATIMFGTDTFLNGYAKYAHPYDFYSVRYLFAGAEKVRSETRKLWFEKFGVKIYEGYGTTEASPVVSINTPMHYCNGSVGRVVPGLKYKILPVEGIEEGGRLAIKGPNVMLGYMFDDKPGKIVPPRDEELGLYWYDTGDIVTVDEDGYLIIKGRQKRFAKIAGEMVSLGAVEEYISQKYPEGTHAAVHIGDEKKGEQIILFSTNPQVTKEALIAYFKEVGLSELYIPKQIKHMDPIPVLSTGKTDYRKILELAQEMTSQENNKEEEAKE